MSRVVRFSVTKRPASGTHTRRVWMLRFCHLFVLMFECETFCARTFRLPVMSLFAMATLASFFARQNRSGARKVTERRGFVKEGRQSGRSARGETTVAMPPWRSGKLSEEDAHSTPQPTP